MADNKQTEQEKQKAGQVNQNTERYGRQYGRRWKVLIYKPAYIEETDEATGVTVKRRDPEHDTAVDVSQLRCTFATRQEYRTQVTTCVLVVYNMNPTAERDIIEEGFQISIEAGYEEAQYGEIFTGDIVQVIRNRESGIDYRLEILALKGSQIFDMNHVRATIAAGSTPRDIVYGITGSARQRIEIGEISDSLSTQALPRGKVLFGTPAKYLRDLTIGNDAYYWEGNEGKLVVKKINDEIPADQCLELTPTTGLIGTPKYGDNGISIQMLLDCRVKMQSLIKINNEIIQRTLISLGTSKGGALTGSQLPQQSIFDEDGEYQVFSVCHKGDTHGDDWRTEVIGVGRHGSSGLLLNQSDINQSAGG